MKFINSLFISVFFLLFSFSFLVAQTSDLPLNQYDWKGSKTKAEPGYVVLKSGKKLEGTIWLKGSTASVTAINYEGEGKKIEFPPAALQSYGLSRKAIGKATGNAGPICESPAEMFDWVDKGIVMNKQLHTSKPRPGYVVLNTGTRHEGELKIKKKDGIITDYEIKTSTEKVKGKISELNRYGYLISQEAVAQENLSKAAKTFYAGNVTTTSGVLEGELAQIKISGRFYTEKVILKAKDGKLTEYAPADVVAFTQTVEGEKRTYIPVEGKFIHEEFKGTSFQVYRNPSPTTINKFATNMVKTGASMGTSIAAQEAVKKDAKDNGYVTNMDSVLRVSSDEQLVTLRDQLVRLGGYNSVEEMNENTENNSLKVNVNAIEFELAGRKMANAEGGIYNREWVILNTKTGEKTVVYKSDYKDLIEPLLLGCYEYLSLEKGAQGEYRKWSGMLKAVALMDTCY